MRDADNNLHCGICGRMIGGVTGLNELDNIKAHVAEHHGGAITTHEALLLRDKWETSSGAAEDRDPPR